MEIILCLLAGAIMGAFYFGFFLLGYHFKEKEKKEDTDALVLTEDNKEFVKEMANWRNFFGGK